VAPGSEEIEVGFPPASWRVVGDCLVKLVPAGGPAAELQHEVDPRGREVLVLSQAPPGIGLDVLLNAVADAARNGELAGLSALNDVSTALAIRVTFDLAPNVDLEVLERNLRVVLTRAHAAISATVARLRVAGTQPAARVGPDDAVALVLTEADWYLLITVLQAQIERGTLPLENTRPVSEAIELIAAVLFSPNVEVLSGDLAPDLRWVIEAGGTDEQFSTTLSIFRNVELVASAGMGGPKLYPGEVMNVSYGASGDGPYRVTLRVHPSVDRVVITTDRGTEVAAHLSEPCPDFGLRFGAAVLSPGEVPAQVRAESQGQIVQINSQSSILGIED
jgi:hypothetical protein